MTLLSKVPLSKICLLLRKPALNPYSQIIVQWKARYWPVSKQICGSVLALGSCFSFSSQTEVVHTPHYSGTSPPTSHPVPQTGISPGSAGGLSIIRNKQVVPHSGKRPKGIRLQNCSLLSHSVIFINYINGSWACRFQEYFNNINKSRNVFV